MENMENKNTPVLSNGVKEKGSKNWFSIKIHELKEWWAEKTKKMDKWSRKKPFRRKMWLNKTLYMMMIPYLVLFFLFTIIPVVMSFLLSFTYFNLLEAPRFIGWANYLALFLDDPIFITALKNTLIIEIGRAHV